MSIQQLLNIALNPSPLNISFLNSRIFTYRSVSGDSFPIK